MLYRSRKNKTNKYNIINNSFSKGNQKKNHKPLIISSLIVFLVGFTVCIYISAKNSNDFQLNLLLASRYYEDKKFELSLEKYKEALKMDRSNSDVIMGLTKTYIRLEKYSEAEALLNESTSLSNGEEYLNALIDLKFKQNKTMEVYDLIVSKYNETNDSKYKNLFDEYFNVVIVSNKYIYKSTEKATFKLYLTDKENNIISTLDENIEVSGDNIKDLKTSKGSVTFGFNGVSEATIKVSEGLIKASAKVLCIDDIDVIGVPNTKVKVNDELELKIQGKSNKTVKTSNKQGTNTKKTIDLSALNNQFVLINGAIEKYEFSNPVITFDEKVVEKIDGDNPFEFKLKAIGAGDIKLNIQWDNLNKTVNKYINPK